MLTRDNEQILLNEIHSLCMEAADHYQATQLKPCVADLEAVLSEAARAHQEFAVQLAAYIRKHDDQPRLPDPDKETLDLFLSSVKARLAGSEKRSLMEDQAKIEQKLCDVIQAALQSSLPPDIKQLLEKIQEKARSMQDLLRTRD